MSRETASAVWLVVLIGILALVVVGLWQVHGEDPRRYPLESRPQGIMGTTCLLRAVVVADQMDAGEEALRTAEEALRRLEVAVSNHLEFSEISELNAAEAGQLVPLTPKAMAVLNTAREYADKTAGAFDVTYAPVFAVWAEAGRTGTLPDPDALEAARQACGWDLYQIHADAVTKLHSDASIDLGGIAKGFGIDKAIQAMIDAGVVGGLVDVGGDIRCFGQRSSGGPWRIAVRNPFSRSGEILGVIELKEGAVCTSGDYERFSVIDGVRYSHIVDPRTCRPVQVAPSVTVIAPTATAADAWATALSVLGPRGTQMIDPDSGVEALLILGTPEDHELFRTSGFDAYLAAPASAPAPVGQ